MKKFFVLLILFTVLILTPKFIKEYEIFHEEAVVSIPSSNNSEFTPIFSASAIPDNVYESMLGKSIPFSSKYDVDISSLSYLQISYFGFDKETHVGEMIVNSKLAGEVLEIFKELYECKYPIEKIRLIDEYNADDEASMSDNNTSAFCFRVIAGTKKLSNHAMRNRYRYKSFI